MSVKVYCAYKVKGSDLFGFLSEIKPRVELEWQTRYLQLVRAIAADMRADSPHLYESPDSDPLRWKARCRAADVLLTQEYRKQAAKATRDFFDFSVSLRIYHYKGFYYCIPNADMYMSKVWDFLRESPLVSDYSYWDNVDPLKGVPPKEWNARGKVWKALLDSKVPTVVFEVCTPDGMYLINPFWYMGVPGHPANNGELKSILEKPEPWPSDP